jgi:hypothetical protein
MTITSCQNMLLEIIKTRITPEAVANKTQLEFQALSVQTKYGEISITYSQVLKDKQPIEVVN